MKVEMRGHDNTLECAVFVPAVAAPSIRELIKQVRHCACAGASFGALTDMSFREFVARDVAIVQGGHPRAVVRCHRLARQDDQALGCSPRDVLVDVRESLVSAHRSHSLLTYPSRRDTTDGSKAWRFIRPDCTCFPWLTITRCVSGISRPVVASDKVSACRDDVACAVYDP